MDSRYPPGARVAAIASAAMIAQQVAGKATRDAYYLSHFSAATLPRMMGLSAVVSLVTALWLSQMLTRYTPARVVPFGFLTGMVTLIAIWGLSFGAPRAAAILLYVHTALFGAAMISAFWSLINETFDPHTSRRAITAITSGGTLGGLVGGIAAWRLSSLISVPTMLPLLAASNLVCVWGSMRTAKFRAPVLPYGAAVASPDPEPAFAWSVLRDVPYLRNVAAIVALGAVTSGLLDYVFSVEAARVFAKGPQLLSFFSLFWVAVGILSFGLQTVMGRISLERLGLVVNVAILPGIVVLGSAAGLAVPGLPSLSLLRGAEAVQRNSLFRAAYEMLYAPLSERNKRATKTVIDVGFDRLGTMLAAAIAAGAVWLAGSSAEAVVLGAAMAVGLACLTRSRPLHLGYVKALEESLRRGAEAQALLEPLPGASRPSTASRLPDEVVGALDVVLTPPQVAAEHEAAVAVRAQSAASAQDLADLTSGDPARVGRVLSGEGPIDRMLVAFVIPWLSDKQLREPAMRAMKKVAPLVPGQLADVLCDPGIDVGVRRRVPRLLAECPTQQVVEALLRGAEDDKFEVRYECGRALLKVTKAHPELLVPLERVIAIVKLEVSLDHKVWESQPQPEFDDEANEPVLIDRLLRDRLDRSMEHVFTMLALQLDRESLAIAFKALHGEDDRLRGTALEYLETVLPTEIRDAVWPFLGAERPMRPARAVKEILADLRLAMGDVPAGSGAQDGHM